MEKMICLIRIIANDCIFMCKKNYTSNQKPQRCISFMPSFQPLRGLAVPFALWVALQSIQPANLLSLGCKGESFSKKTSEKQSRNWNRIALYNLCHSHWWEKHCRTTGKMEKYISLCCTFKRSYFVFCF